MTRNRVVNFSPAIPIKPLNVLTVMADQTIQEVIDSCPAAIGNLKEGFTNSFVVKVPPGHEKEFYSTVRNTADAASDKRNVKVVYEDNPDGKFQLRSYDRCETITGWSVTSPTVLSLDTDHATEGESCFKLVNAATSGDAKIYKASLSLDWREYQGLLFDVELDPLEVVQIRCYIWSSMSPAKYLTLNSSYNNYSGMYKGKVFIPFWKDGEDVDLDEIVRVDFRFIRESGYEGTITGYVDNFCLLRTFPCNVAILRYDDGLDEHWTYMKRLDEKGWKGCYGIYGPNNFGSATRLSVSQIQHMYNAGHDIINHSTTHPGFNGLSDDETYYNFYGMKKWLAEMGFYKALNLFINPGAQGNKYLIDILAENAAISTYSEYGGFPVMDVAINDSAFDYSGAQSFLDQKGGGCVQFVMHGITNDTNYVAFLDWAEANFSEVLTFSQILEKFPDELKLSTQKECKTFGMIETLSADRIYYSYDGNVLKIDPGGAGRNITPAGCSLYGCLMPFQPFQKIMLINIADTAETLTFDPTFNVAGAHDGDANADTLSDSGEGWTVGQLVGRTINNTTDGSSGTITANDGTTVTAILSGGTDNDWDVGDTYTITPGGLNQAIAQNERGIFVYDGSGWLKIFVG